MTAGGRQVTTILIADDHPMFRAGVRGELEQVPHFSIVGETGDGEEAYQLIRKLRPDVAVLDFQMPVLTGLDIARKLDAERHETRIVLLTMHRDRKIFYTALDAGVQGYVLKDDAVADIVRAISDVASGRHFISADLTGLLIEKAKGPAAEEHPGIGLDALTAAERNILSLVAELKTNEEIAEMLYISKRTVENHKVNISGKLQLEGARHLLRFALQHKDVLM